MTEISPGKLTGLRRLADEGGRFKMLAVDQRPPIINLVQNRLADGADLLGSVSSFKETLVETLGPAASAVLVDPQYIFPKIIPELPHGTGTLITLEHHEFEDTPTGRLSSPIPDWSVGKIKLAGGDAVKVLAWYRPDASERVRAHQKQWVASVGEECRRLDIPFVFELLLYPFPEDDDHTTGYVEHGSKRAEHVIRSVEEFAGTEYGIDVFKLESPITSSDLLELPEDETSEWFKALGEAAGRPWVMLSAGVDAPTFRVILEHAYRAGASGYLAGRAIWWEACNGSYPDLARMRSELAGPALQYMNDLNRLTDELAHPWESHSVFGELGPQPPEAGETFRQSYPGSGQW